MFTGDLKRGPFGFHYNISDSLRSRRRVFLGRRKKSRGRACSPRAVWKKVTCACYAVYAGYNTDISGHCFFLLQPGKKKTANNKQNNKQSSKKVEKEKEEDGGVIGANLKGMVVMCVVMMLMMFAVHCTWVTSNAYSSPSVVLASTNYDG